ncbi:hypothetical protein C0J52_14475 [Blattella germanica]|nr:hypothetical protein C0J52_14475 [Blattella germanica]
MVSALVFLQATHEVRVTQPASWKLLIQQGMNDICKMRRCAILHKNDVIDVIPCRYHVILKHLQIAFCIHCIATRGRRGPHSRPDTMRLLFMGLGKR